METTRKLDLSDVLVLKELQRHLLQRGIKTTQKGLLSEIIEFVSRKEVDFVNFFTKNQQVQKEDSFDEFLRTTYTGKEKTNATLEHDLIT